MPLYRREVNKTKLKDESPYMIGPLVDSSRVAGETSRLACHGAFTNQEHVLNSKDGRFFPAGRLERERALYKQPLFLDIQERSSNRSIYPENRFAHSIDSPRRPTRSPPTGSSHENLLRTLDHNRHHPTEKTFVDLNRTSRTSSSSSGMLRDHHFSSFPPSSETNYLPPTNPLLSSNYNPIALHKNMTSLSRHPSHR